MISVLYLTALYSFPASINYTLLRQYNNRRFGERFARSGDASCFYFADVRLDTPPVFSWFSLISPRKYRYNNIHGHNHFHLLILTEELAIDLDCCLRCTKPPLLCLWPVTEIFQLQIQRAEVQLCFVRVTLPSFSFRVLYGYCCAHI